VKGGGWRVKDITCFKRGSRPILGDRAIP